MKYLVYYDTSSNQAENRNYVLSATGKIDYICSVLNRIGYPVELISASTTFNRKGCEGRTVRISDQTSLTLFPCLGRGNLPKRLLGRWLFKIRLFFYMLLHIRKNETVVVYHSLGYAGMVTLLKKLKAFRLILEVEELYADVSGRERDRKKEYRLFSEADAFIFPTELLREKINSHHRPCALVHGTYQVDPDLGCAVFASDQQGPESRKIHCVYAGTFDPRKGGAMAAASAAEFLPEHYHVHILGFGNQKQTEQIRKLIDGLTGKCKCSVTYDGLLQDEEYGRFLQSCDIGLSTQNPDAAFNGTSFPSKIFSYMANGLRVVSIRIPAVEQSAIGSYIDYYDEQTPEKIAQAIMQVNFAEAYDSRNILKKLDAEFAEDLRAMLEG